VLGREGVAQRAGLRRRHATMLRAPLPPHRRLPGRPALHVPDILSLLMAISGSGRGAVGDCRPHFAGRQRIRIWRS